MPSRLWVAALALSSALPQVASAEQAAAGHESSPSPVVENVDFERHVSSLLRRLGCNSGACHGSFEGRGGFRLSLFGQSPADDFAAIAGDPESGRIVFDAPEQSLLLAKPSTRIQHEGGLRMPSDSWEYALIRRWIAAGAYYAPGSGHVRELVIEPRSSLEMTPGESLSLDVIARFTDDASERVTAFSEFQTSDETVAGVDRHGRVAAIGPGSAFIIASYRGAFARASIIVPHPLAEPVSRLPPANLVDAEIDRRLDQLRLASSPPASDAEFLRRATLDVLGTIPTPDAVREFVASQAPDKRARAIDRLLAHPRRSAVWASKMCDITGCNVDAMESPESLRPKRAKMWYDWFRRRFAENIPYDELVRGVLCAVSRDDEPIDRWIEEESRRQSAAEASFESDYASRPYLDLYWRRLAAGGPPPVEDLAELTASAFLGLRLHCARCHHHPYDRWSQHDFAGFAQVLARVQFGSSTSLRSEVNRQLDVRRQQRASGATFPPLPRLQEVFISDSPRPLVDAAAEADAPPTAPGGPVLGGAPDPRQGLADWLIRRENPFFASNFVNRVWAKYFGEGLVDPVDDMSASNPATHPALLDRLTEEFVFSGFDILQLERMILTSNAYQRSTRTAGNNAADSRNHARAEVRALPAEALIDALNAALETTDDFGPDVPAGSTAYEVAPNRLSGANFNAIFRVLGRGDRHSLCECDRATGPSIRQPIFMMSDPLVLAKIAEGRLARLIDDGNDDREIISEMYLAALSRFPDDDELAFLQEQVSSAGDRRAALADIVWAILNTREFSTNH